MRIAILGSSGSIGTTTLQVIEELGQTDFEPIEVIGLAVKNNLDVLQKQIERWRPKAIAIEDHIAAQSFKSSLQLFSGKQALEELATMAQVDTVIVAVVGMSALKATLAAIRAGKRVLLANKEILISAGPLIMAEAKKYGVDIIPLDSEHSALFQCLQGRAPESIRRLVLTASGGPFLHADEKTLAAVTPVQALAHPTWKMGKKITIDCSTLINKGFEMIEAAYLFDLSADKIDIVIHPQSLVHSFVEFVDGILLAQIHEPNMRYPIQYGLTYPKRAATEKEIFNFTKHSRFEFYPPDFKRFKSIDLSYAALKEGGSVPCYLNAANEELVTRFLREEIGWLDIVGKLEKLLERHNKRACDTLEDIVDIDHVGRREAAQI